MRTGPRWWQTARTPRMAFVIGGGQAVAATGVAFGQPWWLATMWGVLGVANIASGIAMMRAGEPWRSKYPTRWFPFWPPDER